MRSRALSLAVLFGLVISTSAQAQTVYQYNYQPQYGYGYHTGPCGDHPCRVQGIPPMPHRRLPGPYDQQRHYSQPRTTSAYCSFQSVLNGTCVRQPVGGPSYGYAAPSDGQHRVHAGRSCGRQNDQVYIRKQGRRGSVVLQPTSMPLPIGPRPRGTEWGAVLDRETGMWKDCDWYTTKKDGSTIGLITGVLAVAGLVYAASELSDGKHGYYGY